MEGSRSSTDAINESSSMLSLFEKAMSLIKDNRQSKTKAKMRSFSCVFITGGNSKPTKYNVSLYTGVMASRFSCENCPRTEIAALSLLTHWMLEECRSGHLFSQKNYLCSKKIYTAFLFIFISICNINSSIKPELIEIYINLDNKR